MKILYILPLLFLVSCNEQSETIPWVVKNERHEGGMAIAKIHASKFPHRGFDVILQKDGGDEWALLEAMAPSFEGFTEVDVYFNTEGEKRSFLCKVRKGGHIIQLSKEALQSLKELESANLPVLIQAGPLVEQIEWEEKKNLLPSLFKTPF